MSLIVVLAGLLAMENPEIETLREMYNKGQCKRVRKKVDEALKLPDLSTDDRIEVYWMTGACQFSLGKKQEAADSFDQVIALRPLYAIEAYKTPPPVRALYEERQSAYQKAHGITFSTATVSGAQVEVAVAGDVAKATRVILFARRGGSTAAFRSFDGKIEGGTAKVMVLDERLWELAGTAGSMEIVLEARDEEDVPRARMGDALLPVALPITESLSKVAIQAIKDLTPGATPPLALKTQMVGTKAEPPVPTAQPEPPAKPVTPRPGPNPSSTSISVTVQAPPAQATAATPAAPSTVVVEHETAPSSASQDCRPQPAPPPDSRIETLRYGGMASVGIATVLVLPALLAMAVAGVAASATGYTLTILLGPNNDELRNRENWLAGAVLGLMATGVGTAAWILLLGGVGVAEAVGLGLLMRVAMLAGSQESEPRRVP